jgi:AcrR family transcriptional regulator
MPDESQSDRRRDAGARTKQRLLDATLTLLAERGEDAVTLRDVTTAAHANVASVSYHFGSMGALCCATFKHAITQLLDEQMARLQALDDGADVEEIGRAIAQPIIDALSDPEHPGRLLLRIFDRALGGPPGEMQDWIRASVESVDAELMLHLRQALPGVDDEELRFRWDCVAGILRALAAGTARTDLHSKCPADLERLLLPVIAGTLSAGAERQDRAGLRLRPGDPGARVHPERPGRGHGRRRGPDR